MIRNEKIEKLKTGCFERTYNWDLRSLKLRPRENGFLVQKVVRESCIPDEFLKTHEYEDFNHSYFEAWNIQDCDIVYDKVYPEKYDDSWAYGPMPFWESRLRDCAQKYRTKGLIKMAGLVFWVSKTFQIYEQIERDFKKGSVKYAVDLISIRFIDYEDKLLKVFSHQFSHGWDLRTDNAFIDAVAEIFMPHIKVVKKDTMLEDIEKHFSNLPVYPKLKSKLVNRYDQVAE